MDTTTTRYKAEQILSNHFCDETRVNLTDIHNNGENIVASNGKILAEINIEQFPDLKDIGVEVPGFPNYQKILTPDNEQTIYRSINVEELLSEDKNKDPDPVECKNCNGEGTLDHWCDCKYCNEDYETCPECMGDGEIYEGDRFRSYIKIGEYLFQSSLINSIATLFQTLGIEECMLKVQPKLEKFGSAPITVSSEGVLAICSPVFISKIDATRDDYEITKTINL